MSDVPPFPYTIPQPYDPDAVKAAERTVRDWCGWHIAPAVTETLTLNGPGGQVLLLPSLRVTAITSIIEDGVTLDASAYEWSTAGVVKRIGGAWSTKLRTLQVNLTHGYDDCPENVYKEIGRLAAASPGMPVGIRQAQVGQVSVTYGVPGIDPSILAPYQVVAV